MLCVFWHLSVRNSIKFPAVWATWARLLDWIMRASLHSPLASVSIAHPWPCQRFTTVPSFTFFLPLLFKKNQRSDYYALSCEVPLKHVYSFKLHCSLLMYAGLSRYLVAVVQALILQWNLMLPTRTVWASNSSPKTVCCCSTVFNSLYFVPFISERWHRAKSFYLFAWKLLLHAGLERDKLFLHSDALWIVCERGKKEKESQFDLKRSH